MDNFLGTDYADLLQVDKSTGDPLGLAALSERLYNTVFPGYNNTVRHIRVYSSLCWMALQIRQSFDAAPPRSKGEAKERRESAFQKIELALLWANQGGIKGLNVAGAGREFPSTNARQRLAFSEFKGDATLRGNTYYGPSIMNGLGFVDQNWFCTPSGAALGRAFGQQLGTANAHRWLKDIDHQFATNAQVRAAKPALDLFSPSPGEQSAFLASFFPAKRSDCEDDRAENRWYSVHLMLNTIRSLGPGPSTEAQIRAAMARGVTPTGDSVHLSGAEPMQAAWAVLQLRQLQRLATETLFSVVFDWVRRNNGVGLGVGACLAEIVAAARPHYKQQEIETGSDLSVFFKRLQGKNGSLYAAAARSGKPEGDLFEYLGPIGIKSSRLRGAQGGAAVAGAVNALSFCAIEASNLETQKWTSELLRHLDTERASLLALSRAFKEHASRPVTEWIRTLLSEWVFGRYFEVAIQRAEEPNGKLRFDFTYEEAGLQVTGVRTERFEASYSRDKLYHTLLLCAQCGLVSSSFRDGQELFSLTVPGRRRVSSYQQDAK